MLNLIKLEIKKFKLMSSIKGVTIAIISIAAFMCLITLIPENKDRPFNNFADMLFVIDTFMRSTFIIYASSMLAKLFISEFKNKTMNLMFMYPIKRKKILISKLIIVSAFTFISIILGNLIVGTVMFFINKYFNFTPDATSQEIINNIISIVLNAIAASGIALVPLFFGMIKKTTPSTITSSIVIVAFVCSNNSGFTLAKMIPVTLTIGVIGVLMSYLTIRNIENVDVV